MPVDPMDDMGEYWRAAKIERQERRAKRLASTNDEGWQKYTQYHWHRMLCGFVLDYWPSTGKFKYQGKIYQGGVDGFIKKKLKQLDNSYKMECQ